MFCQLFFEGVSQLLELISLFLVVLLALLSSLLISVNFGALGPPLEKFDDGLEHGTILQRLEGKLLRRLPSFVGDLDVYLVCVD